MKTFEYIKAMVNYSIIYKLVLSNYDKTDEFISKINENDLINLRWYILERNNNDELLLSKNIKNTNTELINMINNYIFIYKRSKIESIR